MKTEIRESEPSMDEILASIRQIISGDLPEENKEFLQSSRQDDILDLTNPLPEEVEKKETFKSKKGCSEHINIKKEESIISSAAISEAAQTLYEFNKFAQESPKFVDSSTPEGMGGKTVESLVRETLKPLLKEWLDRNLPTLVRWVVHEQVEKMVHQMARHEQSVEKEKSPFYP